MCHSEIIALDSNLLVDLEIIGQQQVSPPKPCSPLDVQDDIEMSSSVSISLFLSFFLLLSNHRRPQVLAAARATVPLSRF